MKPGTRAVGVAESYERSESTLAAAVVRADRVVDDLRFGTCTVGGTDATAAIAGAVAALDRPDARYLFLAGIAPAWYNVVDLHRLHEATDLPTLSVSFEASAGLQGAIREAFDGAARDERLAVYERQPPREAVTVNGESLFVRSVGCEDPLDVVRAFTPEGGRPEPLRVARLAARAGDAFRRETAGESGAGGGVANDGSDDDRPDDDAVGTDS